MNCFYFFLYVLLVSVSDHRCGAKFEHSLINNNVLYNSMDSSYDDAKFRSYEKCSMEMLSRFLSVEGINLLISELATWESSTIENVLGKVAKVHGLRVSKPPKNSFRNSGPMDILEDAQWLGDKKGEKDQRVNNLLNVVSVPWIETPKGYQVSPPDNLPQALLLIQSGSLEVINSKWIDLQPKMALLDFLKMAKYQTHIDGKDVIDPTFNFKMKRLKSRGCITIATMGPLKAAPYRPLEISIFSSSLQIEWDSPCLPKASEVLIYSGYVITVRPSRDLIK